MSPIGKERGGGGEEIEFPPDSYNSGSMHSAPFDEAGRGGERERGGGDDGRTPCLVLAITKKPASATLAKRRKKKREKKGRGGKTHARRFLRVRRVLVRRLSSRTQKKKKKGKEKRRGEKRKTSGQHRLSCYLLRGGSVRLLWPRQPFA